jgi:N-hydroxyarylamine O-acetyltransferase
MWSQARIDAYLKRIRYTGLTAPVLDTLRGLHQAHLFNVPFENLDIHLGRRIVLEPDRLFDKIVVHRRGGFCYELNGLFAELLIALGFDVARLNARVWSGGDYGIDFDHMVLLVRLDEPYLADVGFGDGYREPLRLAGGVEQVQDFGAYRVLREGDLWRYEEREASGAWLTQYRVGLTPYHLEDFNGGCDYHQTSPESHFTQKRMCTLATPQGRVTLRDTRLIVTANGQKAEFPIAGEGEFRAALLTHFGIGVLTS